MAIPIQVTFDCADPDKLARFWAEALDYILQPPPDGFDSWDAFLESIGVPEDERDTASAVVDPDGQGPRLLFQVVPEGKSAKNRVHLDVNVGGGRRGPGGGAASPSRRQSPGARRRRSDRGTPRRRAGRVLGHHAGP